MSSWKGISEEADHERKFIKYSSNLEEYMELLPRELRAQIPSLYATEHDEDPLVRCKFFTPWSNWTWLITEFDGKDTLFGWVYGHEAEWGYFSLSELQSIRGPF